MKLNEKEALRYLGFRGKPADADTDEMIREIGGEMLRTLTPKCVYKRYDIKVLENAVELGRLAHREHKAFTPFTRLQGSVFVCGDAGFAGRYDDTAVIRAQYGARHGGAFRCECAH
ncbi:hypothetical protein [Hominenteromicrobium sp.]|uniref:hypothetical protein n=1 Tax=Hominenteromicrobium sp. TaxID=3073581 RepID=UPI00399B14F9